MVQMGIEYVDKVQCLQCPIPERAYIAKILSSSPEVVYIVRHALSFSKFALSS